MRETGRIGIPDWSLLGGDKMELQYSKVGSMITCHMCGAIIRNEYEIEGHFKMHSNRQA